ncbi:hypothetical protein B0J12DRAFT_701177 [Macrophomina phaseolina]|uniref:Uncharacterized protein n=1 Tax=Macrophomina phaseolina TaxID=35725 RepID=A0ABQ8G6D9_9PEZI|nr:hypothetical protein B0J12DRAFT_701177 [Macrophomina phaseolina]
MKFFYVTLTFLIGLAAATPLTHDAEAVAGAEAVENLLPRQYDPRCPGGCANRARCCGNNTNHMPDGVTFEPEMRKPNLIFDIIHSFTNKATTWDGQYNSVK